MEGGISYAGPFVHTFSALTGQPHEIGKQPCLTDEAVYQKVLANVKAWLRANPNAKIVSVSQNDSYAEQLGCQCANCKAIDEREGTPMGSLLAFVNRIAGDDMMRGCTIAANGFYGPQGRVLRCDLAVKEINDLITDFRYEGQRITNYEMEGSAIAGLSLLMGHKAMTVCCVIAQRKVEAANTDYKPRIKQLIQEVLERI
jgi:uridine phosphorylase